MEVKLPVYNASTHGRTCRRIAELLQPAIYNLPQFIRHAQSQGERNLKLRNFGYPIQTKACFDSHPDLITCSTFPSFPIFFLWYNYSCRFYDENRTVSLTSQAKKMRIPLMRYAVDLFIPAVSRYLHHRNRRWFNLYQNFNK